MRTILALAALIPLSNFACADDSVEAIESPELDGSTLPIVIAPKIPGMPVAEHHGQEDGPRRQRPGFGPPPPGYWRITGDPVPNWSPASMFAPRSGPLSWTFVGAKPISNEFWSGNSNASGRVVCVAPHPTDPSICYIASASGGIWKTTTGGLTWSPITDELASLNHGYVTIDPNNTSTIYAGTGEYTTGSTGDGLFRSLDAGVTWSRVATTAQVGTQITGIVIPPGTPNTIYVSGNSGLYRSQDGGATWSQRLSSSISSMAMSPTNPNLLLAGRDGDSIYRTINGGNSFTKLTSTHGLPTSGVGRIVLSFAPSDGTIAYAAIASGSNLLGFYRSSNSGFNWTQKTATPNFPSPQAWYDLCVGVSRTDPNIVFAGGVDKRYATAGMIRTTDGGDTWVDVSQGTLGGQLHPDHHFITQGPDGTLWAANDGGVWTSTNLGDSWTNRNANLAVTQNYTIALHPTNINRMATGTQDNGTIWRTSDAFVWPQIGAGDGGFLAYDFNAPDSRMYFTYVYLTVYRRTGGTTTITGPWSGDSVNFIAPLVMDPNNSNTLLGGTTRLWRNTSAATSSSWTAISTTSVVGGDAIDAIAVAPGFSNTIYVGGFARMGVTTDTGANWSSRTTSNGLPTATITDIVINPTNRAEAYISADTSSGSRVMQTTDFGATWTNRTSSLVTGVRGLALAIDWASPNRALYLGTGAGVYYSLNNGASWQKDGTDLPNVNIGDLAIDTVRRTLTAATYGRGVWRTPLAAACPADYNDDGFIDFSDFDDFVTAFESGDPAADFNNDGFLDFTDFDDFVSAFEAGC
jgi:hypothetical protein